MKEEGPAPAAPAKSAAFSARGDGATHTPRLSFKSEGGRGVLLRGHKSWRLWPNPLLSSSGYHTILSRNTHPSFIRSGTAPCCPWRACPTTSQVPNFRPPSLQMWSLTVNGANVDVSTPDPSLSVLLCPLSPVRLCVTLTPKLFQKWNEIDFKIAANSHKLESSVEGRSNVASHVLP